MLSPIEALMQRLTAAGAYVGGIISVVFANLQDAVMANGAFVVSAFALAMNWYYLRRRDRREQAKFEQEMHNE